MEVSDKARLKSFEALSAAGLQNSPDARALVEAVIWQMGDLIEQDQKIRANTTEAALHAGEAATAVKEIVGTLPGVLEQSIDSAGARARSQIFEAGEGAGQNLRIELSKTLSAAIKEAVGGFETRAENKSGALEKMLLERLAATLDRRVSAAGWGIVWKVAAIIGFVFVAGLLTGFELFALAFTGHFYFPFH